MTFLRRNIGKLLLHSTAGMLLRKSSSANNKGTLVGDNKLTGGPVNREYIAGLSLLCTL